jgi:hypothetical protein
MIMNDRLRRQNQYTFGGKKNGSPITKKINKENKNLTVVYTEAFEEQVKEATKLIDEGKYGLKENDFWINERANVNSNKLYYVGLIITHNGCLKINSKLEKEKQYKPSCAIKCKDNEKSLVLEYKNDDQGIHEFGEVHYNSAGAGCTVGFVYAMALKRLQDRVILKNSCIAFEGFYSESETEDFKQSDNIDNTTGEKQDTKKDKPTPPEPPAPPKQRNYADNPPITPEQKQKLQEALQNPDIKAMWDKYVESVRDCLKREKDIDYTLTVDKCKQNSYNTFSSQVEQAGFKLYF